MPSPFPFTSSIPGKGSVHLTLLPPSTPTFSHLTYTYPLKLLPSTPHRLKSTSPSPSPRAGPTPSSSNHNGAPPPPPTPPTPETVPLLFLLTYGGGLVAGDHTDLSVRLDPGTRLTIATQGSTKIFRPSPAPTSASASASSPPPPTTKVITRQDLSVSVSAHAALWLAPDPIQPFAHSLYAQKQIFTVERGGSLGFVDWVSEGRRARGERWDLEGWRGRNEVWDVGHVYGDGGNGEEEEKGTSREKEKGPRRRLLVQDALVLDGKEGGGVRGRMDGMGVFGTVILRGPLFESLAGFFVEEFKALPRIGGRDWSSGGGDDVVREGAAGGREEWRSRRTRGEKDDGVLWTACFVRGCAIVKFAAGEVRGAKAWLGAMLKEEGSVGREFGEGGLMFVR